MRKTQVMSEALVFKKSIEFSNLIFILAPGLNFEEGNVSSRFTHTVAFLAISFSLGEFLRL